MENNLVTKGKEILQTTPKAKLRDSNLELYRIIAMLMIVAHHYVVNSGLIDVISNDPLSAKSLFLLIFGAGGKTGINCFVLITGYFMCSSSITCTKYVKLLFQIYFYRIIIWLLFLFSGYAPFSIKELFKVLFPITSVQQNFTGCFLLFYLCIPFLNILIRNMTELQHIRLIILLGFIYVVLGSTPMINISLNYVSWFCVLYFISSYIRMYDKQIYKNTRLWGCLSIIMICFSICSVICGTWLGQKLGKDLSYFWVSDSNKILAICTGICTFVYFKNIKIKNSIFINTVAASTFGVLLIHANSNTMRQWLWQDVLNNVGMFDSKWIVCHALCSVIGVFTVCTLIDIFRIRYIDKFLFDIIDRRIHRFIDSLRKIEVRVLKL